ncbi:hypothetical protein Tco_1290989, partial [Tanacetum coccineum]
LGDEGSRPEGTELIQIFIKAETIMAHPLSPDHIADLLKVDPTQPELALDVLELEPPIPDHKIEDPEEDPKEDPT